MMRQGSLLNNKMRCLFFVVILAFASNLSAQSPFRFALITDVHIRAFDSNAIQDLKNSVTQINKTDSIDFVLVTGDIADEGDGSSLRIAKDVLDKLNRPFYIVMGNHDTKWSESGCNDFKKMFGYERFKLEHKGFLFLGFNTGPIIRMALGHVAPEDLDWIKQELEINGKAGKPVFLVTHYPMLPDDVDNCFDVTDAVRMYPVKAFLGGHYHSNRFFLYDGIPGFLNRSTLRGSAKVGGYSEYDVTPDSLIVYQHLIGSPRHRWGAISLTKSYYTEAPGSKELRPDFSVNRDYSAVHEDWVVKSRIGIYSSPVVYGKFVYTGDNRGNVVCYSLANGVERWKFNGDGRILGTPAVSKNVLVVGTANSKIYGINAETGKLCWHIDTDASVLGAVDIRKGIAYVGASDHCMRAIRVKDGTEIWKYVGIKGYIETKPLVTSDKVIFGAWDSTLYALDRSTGKLIWKWTGCHPGMHYSPAAVWPVAAHNKVFIADPQRALSAIDLKTGKTLWRTLQSQVRETIGLSADKKRIYSKTMNDSIVCYSTLADKPQEVWASSVGFGYEHAPSMQMEKEGIVFGSTKSGLMFGLDGKTGKVYWKHKVGNTLINTVVPLSKTELLFTNEDGIVGKLKIDKQVYSHNN